MPVDIYSAMIGDPITDQERLDTVAKKLRKQALIGQLGQLAGDKAVAPLGSNLMKQTEAQAEDLSQRGEQARYRRYQEGASIRSDERARAEQAWREKNAAAELAYKYADLKSRADDRALQRALAAEEREERRKDREDAAADKEIERQISKTTSMLDKNQIPGMVTSAENLTDALKKYAGGKDIPGIGVVASDLPRFLLSKEGQRFRSDLAGLANQVLRSRSGAAVTDPETRRFMEELARGGGVSEDVFRTQIPKMFKVIEAIQNNATINLGDAARAEFINRAGRDFYKAEDPFAPALGSKENPIPLDAPSQ